MHDPVYLRRLVLPNRPDENWQGRAFKMIHIERYYDGQAVAWNEFVTQSKNGTFLFHRGYMDYHRSRFSDYSLLIHDDEGLVGILPANRSGNVLYSHQGLTYGGIVLGKRPGCATMLEIFEQVRNHLRTQGIHSVCYKAVPHIYHSYPGEEDLYALFRVGAELTRVEVSAVIALHERWPLDGRKRGNVRRAQREGVLIREVRDFEGFFEIVENRLADRYQTVPVHSAKEMRLLAERFPENIRLFGAYLGNVMVAGAIVYMTPLVIHLQYLSSTAEGRTIFAVDCLVAHLLETLPAKHRYFDFGISNEEKGRVLNTGLARYKEGFGGRAVVHQTFTWIL